MEWLTAGIGRAQPVWLEGSGGPSLSWWHQPEGLIRSAVVILPPIGSEYPTTYRALVELANALSDHGVLAIRVCWWGTGDSSGSLISSTGDEAAAAWRDNVGAAVAAVRALTQAPLDVVALRSGAALLGMGLATRESDWLSRTVSRLLLWDGVPSGRQFVRLEKMIRAGAAPQEIDQSVLEGPGWQASLDVASTLSQAKLTSAMVSGVGKIAVITDDEAAGKPSWLEQIDAVVRAGDEQRAFIEASAMFSTTPVRTMAWVIEWLTNARERRWQCEQVTPVELAEVAPGVTEEVVRLGPHGVTGIVTRLSAPVPPQQQAGLLLVASSVETREGPGSAYARWARELAAGGVTVLRADRRGIGDAPANGAKRAVGHSSDMCADLAAAAQFLQQQCSGPLYALGICSGGYLAAYEGDYFDRVVWINPGAVGGDPDRLKGTMSEDPQAPALTMPVEAGAAWARRRAVKRMIPAMVWRWAGRRNLVDAADVLLDRVTRRTSLYLLLGQHERRYLDSIKLTRSIQRLPHEQRERIAVFDVATLDHAVITRVGQADTYRMMCQLFDLPLDPVERSSVSGDGVTEAGATP